jgi:hypothetical protein
MRAAILLSHSLRMHPRFQAPILPIRALELALSLCYKKVRQNALRSWLPPASSHAISILSPHQMSSSSSQKVTLAKYTCLSPSMTEVRCFVGNGFRMVLRPPKNPVGAELMKGVCSCCCCGGGAGLSSWPPAKRRTRLLDKW